MQESSGLPNKIQITQETADKLEGKDYEINPRGFVHVKVRFWDFDFLSQSVKQKFL